MLLAGAVLVAALVFLRVGAGSLPRQSWAGVDFASLPEVRLLQRYLRIDTTPETGSELAGARFLAAELGAVGIQAEIEELGDGRANLVAIVPGDDPAALVLHNHIDVAHVDAPEEWRFPPFSGHLEPPWIYGRGAFDMKSLAIAQLLALRSLHEGGRPGRSVVFLATGSEEIGSDLGTRWILRTRPRLVERFWAVLTEGGVVEGRSGDDIKYWGTEFSQKRFVELEFCHPRRARLEDLRRDIEAARRAPTGLRLIPEVEAVLARYAPTRDLDRLRQILAAPDLLIGDPARFGEVPAYLQAMFRDEVYASAPEKSEGGYRLRVTLHLLPDADPEAARRELLPEWMTFGLGKPVARTVTGALTSPLDHHAYAGIQQALAAGQPGAPAGPYLLPWTVTDARFFRAAGIVTYGFSPFLLLTSDSMTLHRRNERIALPGFVDGVELYRDLVHRLAHPAARPSR
jgi:acetylornithine deacetylase/succinyl-diaminopimelate desuccinylase-like protein